jgi:uncharacterized Zn-binding protein involved in type VI secretion
MPKGPGANTISTFTNPTMQGGTSTASAAGSPNVNISGVAALRVGETLPTGDSVSVGSTSVRINGQFATRLGDVTAQGGSILTGAFTVLIGG